MFDIDLENEDISDTEVCIERSLRRWLKKHSIDIALLKFVEMKKM